MSAFGAGMVAFREAYLSSGSTISLTRDFELYPARLLRYELLWSFFENDAYRDVHRWSQAMRSGYGLYKYIRGIYNPAYRLARFWQTHLQGGPLDLQASADKGALPIETENDKLRTPIGQVWRDSNWQFKKDLFTLRGVVLGDVGLRVIDDTVRKKVYIDVLHPANIEDVMLDSFGNVKGYTLREYRRDPRSGASENAPAVLYTEVASRDGDEVVYETTLNGQPYGWNDLPDSWSEAYGFIPLVMVQHFNVGLSYGWSELHTGLPKIREADDLGSKLDDQIRKTVDAPWLMSGVKAPSSGQLKVSGTTPTTNEPQLGREEVPFIYGPADAKAQALVASLAIAETSGQIKTILEELERDYPELKIDIMNASDAASGRALRTARQSTETKAQSMRGVYDDATVRIQQMAVSIGGYRGYEGFAGFDLESFGSGQLAHRIADRPVFANDPLDDIEIDKAFWETAGAAKNAGMALDLFLSHEGWSEQDIADIKASPEFQRAAMAMEQQQISLAQQKAMGFGG